jgi:hypothetical protein
MGPADQPGPFSIISILNYLEANAAFPGYEVILV